MGQGRRSDLQVHTGFQKSSACTAQASFSPLRLSSMYDILSLS